MRHISNAHFHQAEITQVDRWEHGPLELVYLPEPENGRFERDAHIHEWNATQRAGFLRSVEAMDGLKAVIPCLEERRNPNMILVPTYGGASELDVMLGSLVPDNLLQQHNLERRRTTLNLLYMHHDLDHGYGTRARAAFTQHIWSLLSPRARLGRVAFAPDSPLRLLAVTRDIGHIGSIALRWIAGMSGSSQRRTKKTHGSQLRCCGSRYSLRFRKRSAACSG